MSRTTTNTDLLTMLLITSDPLVNSYTVSHKKKINALPFKVRNLLKLNNDLLLHTSNENTVSISTDEECSSICNED